MRNKLSDDEWRYLLQMTRRLCSCSTFESLSMMFLQQIQNLITYEKGVVFQAVRESGQVRAINPVTYRYDDQSMAIINDYLAGKLDCSDNIHWVQRLLMPTSSIYRHSDVVSESAWERSETYLRLWKPQNIYFGLTAALVYCDHSLAVMSIYRDKTSGDFSTRDLYIFELLLSTLESKCYEIEQHESDKGRKLAIERKSLQYHLTKRETEIVSLVSKAAGTEDICETLCIRPSTLSKHLSNIYHKTGARSRMELLGLFGELG
ncbi:MAG: response regulator transcription factor [Tractidigestivibacter sp.]|jgi:DNA-binding CsgD family transcriptional regulator|uniref:response regulator transcription factor n=1 Tax=Tractidigestivibacter sp. TaxID=2847320 RepID=UPI003D89C9D3